MIYGKYPEFVKTALNQFERYNQTLDLIKKYENDGKIVVLRPSRSLKIARVEKDLKKIDAIYQLGVNDCISSLDKIKNYLDTKVTIS